MIQSTIIFFYNRTHETAYSLAEPEDNRWFDGLSMFKYGARNCLLLAYTWK